MADLGKGWFKIPGVRELGDRSAKEQLAGVREALVEAPNATVLDLGCAEGLIGLEFAKAGAASVVGVELVAMHIEVGMEACKSHPQVSFVHSDIDSYADRFGVSPPQYDIVLILSIIHKVPRPAKPLLFAARSARSLLLLRPPHWAKGFVIGTKDDHESIHSVNAKELLEAEGFGLERIDSGARNEPVQYWRRLR